MCPASTPSPRYSEEEKRIATEYLLSHRRNFTATVRELEYPATRGILRHWYLQYLKGHEISAHYQCRSSYSVEERERAVKYYIENHVSVKETVQTLGYPTNNTLYKWLKEDAPDVFYTRACHQQRSPTKMLSGRSKRSYDKPAASADSKECLRKDLYLAAFR